MHSLRCFLCAFFILTRQNSVYNYCIQRGINATLTIFYLPVLPKENVCNWGSLVLVSCVILDCKIAEHQLSRLKIKLAINAGVQLNKKNFHVLKKVCLCDLIYCNN